MFQRFIHIHLADILMIGFLPLVFGSYLAAHHAIHQAHTAHLAAAKVPVKAPSGTPSISQESIDLALQYYGIHIPSHVDHPTLDRTISERGITTKASLEKNLSVVVGPSAFKSWSLLASTLSHEIEVHCKQNFLFVRLLDSLGLHGTIAAERQAYQYEIDHSVRFGLSDSEKAAIKDTMEFYYPKPSQNSEMVAGISESVHKLLAR